MLTSNTNQTTKIIGLGDRTNQLRTKLNADLLLLNNDIQTDVTAVTQVATVVSRGRVVHSHAKPGANPKTK